MARPKANPAETLRHNRAEAIKLANQIGVKRLKKQLEEAQRDLEQRLRRAEGLRGPGKDSFTAEQLRVTIVQVRDVLRELQKGMKDLVLEQGKQASDKAVGEQLEYLRRAERRFRGINARIPIREASMLDRVRKGTESSILHRIERDPKHPGRKGVMNRYGSTVIEKFEEKLRQRFLARQSWDQVRNELISESDFLQKAPAHWAERIVRTETMGAYNRAGWETTRASQQALGDMVKILSATFDGRTAADSYAVHGQIRRPHEAFVSWFGRYQHPPNRPNDREVVVPHRVSWPLPEALKWRSDGEVAARWAQEGRKGGPPPRPEPMTTVALERFGKEEPPPVRRAG